MEGSIGLIQGQWHPTESMTASLERITVSREIIEQYLSDAEPWHGAIRKQVMAAVVHYSTKIEGNKLTRQQVESIIAGEVIEAPEKDKIEAMNYLRAMQWAQTKANDPSWFLTNESITTLHFLIGQNLGDDYHPLGKYREGQNQVSDRTTGQVIYWPPRPAEVAQLMDELIDWSRAASDGRLDPYISNALLHLMFVAIHPFSDGNGRVARVLCSLLMMRQGHKAQAFYSLEEYFGVHWEAYGQNIEKAIGARWNPENADCTAWIEWYLDAIATQVLEAERVLQRTIAQLGVLTAIMHADQTKLGGTRLAVATWLAVRDGQVTNRSYRSATDISSATASQDLHQLTAAGYLTREGERRGSRYAPGEKVTSRDYQRLVEKWLTNIEPGGIDAAMQAVITDLRDVPPTPTPAKLFE